MGKVRKFGKTWFYLKYFTIGYPVLQHSGCIMYYWLFYVPVIYLYCTVHSPSTLFLC